MEIVNPDEVLTTNISEMFGLKTRGRGPVKKKNHSDVLMSVNKAGGGRFAIAFRVGDELMRMARWVIGDRVTIDIDCKNRLLTIRRVLGTNGEMSWKLSCSESNTKEGETRSAVAKIIATNEMIDFMGIEYGKPGHLVSDVVLDGRGITFRLPIRECGGPRDER